MAQGRSDTGGCARPVDLARDMGAEVVIAVLRVYFMMGRLVR